ncbi:MAG: hypothetical protein M1837_005147 [Sclerophora amabilis]|nr:MAG: hypothetical protein M1837_005147 [Sclerophora amabilis]
MSTRDSSKAERDVECWEQSSYGGDDHPYTEAEEKALVKKIDLYLLPTIWLMYLLSYVDRTNIGNAKIAGMQEDLNLSSNQYSVSLVVFFVGYVVFEVPSKYDCEFHPNPASAPKILNNVLHSSMILSKSRPSIFLPIIMILWGIATCCMAAAKSYKHVVALRTIIGCLEAGFAPGILLILSSWYKSTEQSKRFAVYISAAILSGAFGGLLGGSITSGLEGVHGIRGWRWLFIVEGAATIGWAMVARFILLDFPATSKRLTEREKTVALLRLKSDKLRTRAGDNLEPSHIRSLKQSMKNWRTWIFTFGYMVIVGSSTLSYFYPTLVEGLGYTSNQAQYMTVPIYGVAFVCTAITGYFCDKSSHKRGMVISIWLSLSMACAIVVCTVYNFKARYVLLVFMAAGLWSTNALSLSYASSTFGSMQQETRAVSLAFVNAMGNLAQIYGAYLFPSEDAPKYIMGFSVISAMCAFGVVVYAAAHVLIRRYPANLDA